MEGRLACCGRLCVCDCGVWSGPVPAPVCVTDWDCDEGRSGSPPDDPNCDGLPRFLGFESSIDRDSRQSLPSDRYPTERCLGNAVPTHAANRILEGYIPSSAPPLSGSFSSGERLLFTPLGLSFGALIPEGLGSTKSDWQRQQGHCVMRGENGEKLEMQSHVSVPAQKGDASFPPRLWKQANKRITRRQAEQAVERPRKGSFTRCIEMCWVNGTRPIDHGPSHAIHRGSDGMSGRVHGRRGWYGSGWRRPASAGLAQAAVAAAPARWRTADRGRGDDCFDGGQRRARCRMQAEKARMTEEKLRPLLVPLPGQALRQYLEARTVPQAQAPVKPALQKQAMFGWGALRLDPVSKPAGQTWSMRHLVD